MTISRFYAFDDIAAAGDCLEFATGHCGMTPVRGHKDRFNAPWRTGSDSGALCICKTGFIDHTRQGESDHKGGIIRFAELFYRVNTQEAQQILGDYYRLTSKKMKQSSSMSVESLKADGYTLVKTYEYQDEAGVTQHSVTRLEHPSRKKEFVQASAAGGNSLKGVKRMLYLLPKWKDKTWVCLCEGEKCADAVAALGIPATTNCGGAGNWEEHYDEWLEGKGLIIFEDNDDAGRARTAMLAPRLIKICKPLKIVSFPKEEKGFDVADWLEADKTRGQKELLALIKDTPQYAGSDLELAKLANEEPLRNFLEQTVGKKKEFCPRNINNLIGDVHVRFLKFPRRIGERMFDHDRDTKRIEIFSGQADLFAWMQRKSKNCIPWRKGDDGFVSKEELYSGLSQGAIRYEGIHHVPDWPKRQDVYYTCKDPAPVKDGAGMLFWELVDSFNPATDTDRSLIAALFAAPIYYRVGVPRPMWVIDSESSMSGKTTLASMVAELYNHPPIEVKVRDFQRDTQELTKRFVSSEGRQARIVLIDNISNTLSSQELAAFATLPFISGRAPYGKGEETRPNNLTWILTANNVTLDNDLAIRSFIIKLKRPKQYNADWRTETSKYIAENRAGIFADIVQMLNTHQRFILPAISRFPEFEVEVLQPCCRTEDNYANLMKSILASRNEANVDEDIGKQVEDAIRTHLSDLHLDHENQPVFIQSPVATRWLAGIHAMHNTNPMGYVRSLAREGHTPHIDSKIQTWPHNGPDKRRGIMWNPTGGELKGASIIKADGEKKEMVVT